MSGDSFHIKFQADLKHFYRSDDGFVSFTRPPSTPHKQKITKKNVLHLATFHKLS